MNIGSPRWRPTSACRRTNGSRCRRRRSWRISNGWPADVRRAPGDAGPGKVEPALARGFAGGPRADHGRGRGVDPMAPVAGSAYTYAYATLGELLAWIIGWDLILEYAMSCATVAASWSKYFNEFLRVVTKPVLGREWVVPSEWCHDPFSQANAYMNLPAVCVLLLVTAILVIGIRESAAFNTLMVLIKLGVVLFVIAIGVGYVNKSNWHDVPVEARRQPQEVATSDAVQHYVDNGARMPEGSARHDRIE